jgi:hypothetical protein
MSRNHAIAALLTAAALTPATAVAATAAKPAVDVHPIFGASASHRYSVGQPLFVAPRGKATVRSVCWTPAPIDAPACSLSKFGAPARTGTQKITVTLKNGAVLDFSARVHAAATKLPGAGGGPARPLAVTCTTRFYGNGYNGHLHDERKPALATGDHVAAYYRVPGHRHLVQVWDYRHRRAGFVRDACLTAPASLASLS